MKRKFGEVIRFILKLTHHNRSVEPCNHRGESGACGLWTSKIRRSRKSDGRSASGESCRRDVSSEEFVDCRFTNTLETVVVVERRSDDQGSQRILLVLRRAAKGQRERLPSWEAAPLSHDLDLSQITIDFLYFLAEAWTPRTPWSASTVISCWFPIERLLADFVFSSVWPVQFHFFSRIAVDIGVCWHQQWRWAFDSC